MKKIFPYLSLLLIQAVIAVPLFTVPSDIQAALTTYRLSWNANPINEQIEWYEARVYAPDGDIERSDPNQDNLLDLNWETAQNFTVGQQVTFAVKACRNAGIDCSHEASINYIVPPSDLSSPTGLKAIRIVIEIQ